MGDTINKTVLSLAGQNKKAPKGCSSPCNYENHRLWFATGHQFMTSNCSDSVVNQHK